MSLPSKAVFYDKNGEVVKSIGINCGWVYNGKKSVVNVILDIITKEWEWYSDKITEDYYDIPEDYDNVKIYEEILKKDEMDYIINRLHENGKYQKRIDSLKKTKVIKYKL